MSAEKKKGMMPCIEIWKPRRPPLRLATLSEPRINAGVAFGQCSCSGLWLGR